MKFTEWSLLILFLVILLSGGILLPMYLTYYVILFKGFGSILSFIIMIFNSLSSYSTIKFLKDNWNKKA